MEDVRLNEDFRRWTLSMWLGLRDGQFWAIPRSGTVFQRRGDVLVFIEGDHHEFDLVRGYFENIGVPVVKDGYPIPGAA